MTHGSQSNYHFQYEVVEHCVPLSLCIYGILSKAERVTYCLHTHYGLFTLPFPARRHTSSSAFRQHSQRIQKKLLLCVQPFPLPCPSSSLPRSQHMETIQLDLNSSVHSRALHEGKEAELGPACAWCD